MVAVLIDPELGDGPGVVADARLVAVQAGGIAAQAPQVEDDQQGRHRREGPDGGVAEAAQAPVHAGETAAPWARTGPR